MLSGVSGALRTQQCSQELAVLSGLGSAIRKQLVILFSKIYLLPGALAPTDKEGRYFPFPWGKGPRFPTVSGVPQNLKDIWSLCSQMATLSCRTYLLLYVFHSEGDLPQGHRERRNGTHVSTVHLPLHSLASQA